LKSIRVGLPTSLFHANRTAATDPRVSGSRMDGIAKEASEVGFNGEKTAQSCRASIETCSNRRVHSQAKPRQVHAHTVPKGAFRQQIQSTVRLAFRHPQWVLERRPKRDWARRHAKFSKGSVPRFRSSSGISSMLSGRCIEDSPARSIDRTGNRAGPKSPAEPVILFRPAGAGGGAGRLRTGCRMGGLQPAGTKRTPWTMAACQALTRAIRLGQNPF